MLMTELLRASLIGLGKRKTESTLMVTGVQIRRPKVGPAPFLGRVGTHGAGIQLVYIHTTGRGLHLGLDAAKVWYAVHQLQECGQVMEVWSSSHFTCPHGQYSPRRDASTTCRKRVAL